MKILLTNQPLVHFSFRYDNGWIALCGERVPGLDTTLDWKQVTCPKCRERMNRPTDELVKGLP